MTYTLGDSVAYEVDESQLGETEAKHDMVCNIYKSDSKKGLLHPQFEPITTSFGMSTNSVKALRKRRVIIIQRP